MTNENGVQPWTGNRKMEKYYGAIWLWINLYLIGTFKVDALLLSSSNQIVAEKKLLAAFFDEPIF